MNLLLDTHALIWLAHEPHKIPLRVAAAIAAAETTYVSVATAWEYGIKRATQPEALVLPFEDLFESADMQPLGLDFACHSYSETLPPIHADPFDRMLVAQALHHGLTLVTNDRAIRRYPVETLW